MGALGGWYFIPVALIAISFPGHPTGQKPGLAMSNVGTEPQEVGSSKVQSTRHHFWPRRKLSGFPLSGVVSRNDGLGQGPALLDF